MVGSILCPTRDLGLLNQGSHALPWSTMYQSGKSLTHSTTKEKSCQLAWCPVAGAVGPWWNCSLCFSPQLVRYSSDGVLQLGPLGSTAFLPDSKCLVDDGKGRTPTLKKCEDVLRPAQRFWDFTQVRKSSESHAERNWRETVTGRIFNGDKEGL